MLYYLALVRGGNVSIMVTCISDDVCDFVTV